MPETKDKNQTQIREWAQRQRERRQKLAEYLRDGRRIASRAFPDLTPRERVRWVRDGDFYRRHRKSVPVHRPKAVLEMAEDEAEFARSPIPRTRHSGNDSYTHCGLDDMHGYAREEAEVHARNLYRLYNFLTRGRI